MIKKLFCLFAAVAVFTMCTPSAVPQDQAPDTQDPTEEEPSKEEPTVDPEDLEPFSFSVEYDSPDNIFTSNPVFKLHLENPNKVAATATITLNISTDMNKKVSAVSLEKEVEAGGSVTLDMTPEEVLAPGFYRARGKVDSKYYLPSLSFGVSPEKIEYDMSDLKDDFNSYWDSAIAELEKVDMSPRLVEITSRSSSARKVYFVELKSVANGPGTEPETIHGYYIEPQDGKKHPVIMHYEGYDTQPPYGAIPKMYCPSGGSSAEFAEFYVSTRGQMINARTSDLRSDGIQEDFANTYGDWFAFDFGKLDSYYYRGAFMDCVQCIRFMATRETSDMENVFAEGKSQGGAFSYAAAALSPYPLRAIAPGVAFLGDFPEYFNIVSWPGDTAKSSAKAAGMSTEEMYAFLSYFDTKNLATRIPEGTSVIANMGLQDGTCPPRTNQAPFNTVKTTDKEMHVYPKMGHDIPSGWDTKITAFFRARIK